ncbi:MAG TPA: VPLPA-CTERM sorting domain-containing protein [Gammaproteobacteria bacterium]|nr:VPLPA-CTERM sorting domain-containing protein [Gammaproteobacteria bacterium]
MDFLAFNGAAGTGVKLTVASLTGGLDPNLEVWDPLGNLIENVFCNGNSGRFGGATLCSVAPNFNLTKTGIYKIGLNDVNWDETGNYRLSVSCLYGACPSVAPSAVPLPAAVWLFGGGLLGLAAVFRRRKQI